MKPFFLAVPVSINFCYLPLFAQQDPDKASFKKLSIQANSSFTGNLNTSIDLLTVPGRAGLDFPIRINYSHDINYGKHASWVGLNWNLQLGSITRTVNMVPDDQRIGQFSGANSYNLSTATTTLEQDGALFGGTYDDFDTYLFNSNTGTEELVPLLDPNVILNFQTQQYKGWQIWYQGFSTNNWMNPKFINKHIEKWQITKEDGTKYFFGNPCFVTISNILQYGSNDPFELRSGIANIAYPYSWDLKKITTHDYVDLGTPNELDSNDIGGWVKFNYQAPKTVNLSKRNNSNRFLPDEFSTTSLSSEYLDIGGNYTVRKGVICDRDLPIPGAEYVGDFQYKLSKIESIETPTHKAVFISSQRTDFWYSDSDPENKLDEIILYKKVANNGLERISRVEFIYEYKEHIYFGESGTRSFLELKKIQRYGRTDDDKEPPYDFSREDYRFTITYPEGGRKEYEMENDSFRWYTSGWGDTRLKDLGIISGSQSPFSQYYFETDKLPWYNSTQTGLKYGGSDYSLRIKNEKIEDGLGTSYTINYTYGEGVLSEPKSTNISTFYSNMGTNWWQGNVGYRSVTSTYPDGLQVLTKFTSSVPISHTVNGNQIMNDERESYPMFYQNLFANPQGHEDGNTGIRIETYEGLHGIPYETQFFKNGKEFKKEETIISNHIIKINNGLLTGGDVPPEFSGGLSAWSNKYFYDENLRMVSDGSYFADYRNGELVVYSNTPIQQTFYNQKYVKYAYKSYWNQWKIQKTTIDSVSDVKKYEYNSINNLPSVTTEYRKTQGSLTDADLKITKTSFAYEAHDDLLTKNILIWPKKTEVGTTVVEEDYYKWDTNNKVYPFGNQDYKRGEMILDATEKPGLTEIEKWAQFKDKNHEFYYSFNVTIDDFNSGGGLGFWFRTTTAGYFDTEDKIRIYYPPNFTNPEDISGGYYLFFNTSSNTTENPTGLYSYVRSANSQPQLHYPSTSPFVYDKVYFSDNFLFDKYLHRNYAAPNGSADFNSNYFLKKGKTYHIEVFGYWTNNSGTGIEVRIDNQKFFVLIPEPLSNIVKMGWGNGGATGLTAYKTNARILVSEQPAYYETEFYPMAISDNNYSLLPNKTWAKTGSFNWFAENPKDTWKGYDDPDNEKVIYSYDNLNRLKVVENVGKKSIFSDYKDKKEKPSVIAEVQNQSSIKVTETVYTIIPPDEPAFQDNYSIDNVANQLNYIKSGNVTVSAQKLVLDGSISETKIIQKNPIEQDGFSLNLSYDLTLTGNDGISGLYLSPDQAGISEIQVNTDGTPAISPKNGAIFISFKTSGNTATLQGVYNTYQYLLDNSPSWYLIEEGSVDYLLQNPNPLILALNRPYKINLILQENTITGSNYLTITIADVSNNGRLDPIIKTLSSHFYDAIFPLNERYRVVNRMFKAPKVYLGLFSYGTIATIDNLNYYLTDFPNTQETTKIQISEYWTNPSEPLSDLFSASKENWNSNQYINIVSSGDGVLKQTISNSNQIMTSKSIMGNEDYYVDCLLNNSTDIGILVNGNESVPSNYQLIQLKTPNLNFIQKINGVTTTTVLSTTLQTGANRKLLVLVSRSKNKFMIWLDGQLVGSGSLNNLIGNFVGVWFNNDLSSSFDYFKAYPVDSKVVNIAYEPYFDQVNLISGLDDKIKKFNYDNLGRLTEKSSQYIQYGNPINQSFTDMTFSYDWGRTSPTFTYPMTKPNSIKTIDYTANPASPSEAIGFFDGLGRNIQNKVKITGSSSGTLITGSIFDQNGSEAGSSIPVWSASTSLTYSPTFWTTATSLPLAGASLSNGMIYDYALSQGYTAAEASKAYKYSETDALGRVTTSYLPGHLNGKIRTYYASNKDHEMPLSLHSQFGTGVPSLSRTETRDALGNGSFTFTDNFGKTIATVSKVGTEDSWTLYKYNLLNQLLEVKHPDLSHTYYTYDTHGNVVKKETPYFDKPFEYRYDQYNRVRFSRDANDFNTGIFHYFKYNKAGQVIETGTVIENATNDFETLEDSTFGDPAMDFPLTGKTADYQYFYGPELAYSNATYTLGRLAKEISLVNKETGATSIRYYSYNADGQIIWTVDEFPGILPKKITYTNDRKGNLKTLSYEDGKKDAFTQFFDYNSAGQMEVSYAGQFTDFAANYRRKTGVYYYFADGRGKQTQFAAANGTSILQSVDYSFGIEGWMKKINDLTSTTDLYAMDYSYLQNGQISAINQKIDGTFTASVNQSLAEETTFGESYTYDNASRLTAATSTGSIASKYNSTYNYDLMGNITKLTRKNNNTDMDKMSYLYGSRNRLIGITDQVASTAFTTDYDAALTTGTSLDQEVFSDNFNTGSYTQSGWSVSTANAHSFLNETGLLKIKPATMTGLNTSVFASLKSPVVTTPGGMRYLLTGLVYTSGYNAQVRLEWQKIVNNVVTVIRSDIKTVINPANGAQSLVVTAPEDAQQVVIYLELKSSALTDYATFDDIKFVEVVGFKYDANGNVISDRYRGLTTIEYNGFNLPSKLVNSASQTVNYGYAGTGSRILKKVNSTSNWYLRTVTGEILAEIEETGSVEKLKYVKLFGNKGVIGEYTPSYTGNYNYHFNLEDHLGNNKVTFTDKALASDGFEAQTVGTGLPTGLWSNTDGPTSPVSRVATVTDTQGGKSLALTTAANNYPYEYVQIESITKGVTAGTSYFLKAWGKAGSSSAGVFIGLGWYNSSNVLLSESWLFNNEKQTIWKQKGASFVAPTGATKVKILLKNASSVASTAYFDEIWLGESSDRVLVEQTQDFYPYGSTMRQYSSSVSTENVSKFKYQGKERDIESGYDYFGGRLFDPQIGRSMQVDPMAEKYIANSPFTSMGNNPILTIDPDGKDIIVLNNPKGAYINGQHYGHMAALVGSDKEGWKFISKQGRNDKAPGLNNQIVGGPSEVLERSYNTLAEFEKDQKDNKDGMEAYTESTRYSTSSSEDSEAFGAMKESAQSWYHGLLNNCADAVSAGFEKIGLDPGVTKDESNNPNSIGKPLEAKNPRPNVRYAEMKKNNKNRIKKKQDESKKYNPTQDENDIDKER